MERLDHSHDVLALAVAPTGRVVATATLDGQIYLWNAVEGELLGTIEGRRDIGGGRAMGDSRSVANRDAGRRAVPSAMRCCSWWFVVGMVAACAHGVCMCTHRR